MAFANKVITSVVKKEVIKMPFYLFSTLQWWNTRLIPVFGFPLNFLLFWLVWTKTPKEMWVHSRILLQTCIVDFIYLTIGLIAIPVTMYQGSLSMILMEGYFVQSFASIFHYDPSSLLILGLFMGLCLYFDIYSVSVQFVYRYLLLTRNMQISLGKYLLMLIAPLIADLIQVLLFILLNSRVPINDDLKASLNDYIDWDNSIYIIGKNNEIFLFTAVMGIAISTSINIFCGVKLVKFVRAHAVNPRTKELNQQLTKTLIILAFYPFGSLLTTMLLSPLVLAMKMMIAKEMLEKLIIFIQYVSIVMANWLPVINPLVSIWINKPYRDAIKKFLANLSIFNKNSVVPVQPING